MSNKKLFLIILLANFLLANLFWFGTIDQDYFFFYYIGQEVSQGEEMYSGTPDNKGPVLYIFFAILNLIFRSSYDIALIVSSTAVDTLSLFILFKIIERRFNFKWFKKNSLNLLFVLFSVALYKSFTIGQLMGGLYSENIGMLWLVLSYYALTSKKFFLSGIIFSLSFLTRLSFLAFVPLFLVDFIFNKKDRRKILHFIMGTFLPLILFAIYFYFTNDLNEFIYSNFNYNFSLLKTTLSLPISILYVIFIETRILIILLIAIFVASLNLVSEKSLKEKAIFSALLIGSTAATFAGGATSIFYYHHFFQFNFLAIVALSQIAMFRNLRSFFIPLVSILAFFIFTNYYIYVHPSQNSSLSKKSHPIIKEVESNKFLMIPSYHSSYYFIYDKRPPDRYIVSPLVSKALEDYKKHLEIKKEMASQTAFLFVEANQFDKKINYEYKRAFAKEFNLRKTNEYLYKQTKIEVYESIDK